MDPSLTDLLQQGIAAARAGKRDEARALLTRVVEADERNEQAWMWLSGVLDDPDDIRTCLHNALDLNPNNTQARQGLAWVDAKYGPPAPKPAPAPAVAVAPPIPAPPESQPAAPQSYTGPTTRLVPEALPKAPPAPMPAVPALATAVVESATQADADPHTQYPCPYCGTPTALAQQNCTQCRENLMIRTAPPDKRSLPLTILGGLWIFNGVMTILGGILGTVGALALMQLVQSAIPRGRVAPAASSFSLVVLVPVVIGLLVGVFIFRVGRGLLRRERWTYYVVIVLSVLGLIGTIINLAQLGGVIAALKSSGPGGLPASSARSVNVVVAAASAGVFVAIGMQVLYLLLVGLSYRDFFGPQVRFQPVVEPADDIAHYNNGIAYKNRRMWYMAVQEWFAASRKRPQDKMYLQALGLAYAQIKKIYPASPSHLRDVESFLMTKRADLYALAPELEQIKLLG